MVSCKRTCAVTYRRNGGRENDILMEKVHLDGMCTVVQVIYDAIKKREN